MFLTNRPPLSGDTPLDLINHPILHGVEWEVGQILVPQARQMHVTKGDVLARRGEIPKFFVVTQGWVAIYQTSPEGQESILHLLTAGDSFPDVGVLNQTAFPWDLCVIADGETWQIPASAMLDALAKSPALTQNMLKAAAVRAQQLLNRIELLTLRTAEGRVGRFLLQLRLGQKFDQTEIKLPFDKALIATYLNIKPETLSRVLQQFRERGFSINANRVGLPDGHALCDYCDLSSVQKCAHHTPSDCPNPAV